MIFHVLQKENLSENEFPSIQEAYDRLVLCHQRGLLDGPSTVFVHKGDYVLTKPLHFYADLPVEIRPFGKDPVTISGGAPVSGWKKTKLDGRTVWKTTLPDTVNEVPFLFVNGKMIRAARWPKKDFFRVEDATERFASTGDHNCDHFRVRKGDFDPKWRDPENITVRLIHLWIEENLTVKSFDEASNTLYTSSAIRYAASKLRTEYAFYNVKEALCEPGEYFFDRKKHELWLIPDSEKFQAVIPACGTLARFDSGVKWVTLSGLHFRYGGAYLPRCQENYDLRDPGFETVRNHSIGKTESSGGKKDSMPVFSAPQAACHVPGVIFFHNASDCTVKDCSVTACSWYGIHAADSCRNLTFSGNEISGLGAGGFCIGGGDAGEVKRNPETLTERITVRGNHIHDCGRYFFSADGILLTHACGCVMEENHIHDLYYSGISCGWVWGYAESVTKGNSICRNHIHDLGKGVLSDMGGIYLLGSQPGTYVRGNLIHGIVNRNYGGWGLYTDQGSSHIVLEKNVIYDCACNGFHQHYGRENIVRFNVFAFHKKEGFSMNCIRKYDWEEIPDGKAVNVFQNVILTDGTPPWKVYGSELISQHKIFSDGNIIFDVSGKKDLPFADIGSVPDPMSRTEWQKNGMDRHSLFQDPGFVNAEKRDFRLKKNSILREYGFDFLEEVMRLK